MSAAANQTTTEKSAAKKTEPAATVHPLVGSWELEHSGYNKESNVIMPNVLALTVLEFHADLKGYSVSTSINNGSGNLKMTAHEHVKDTGHGAFDISAAALTEKGAGGDDKIDRKLAEDILKAVTSGGHTTYVHSVAHEGHSGHAGQPERLTLTQMSHGHAINSVFKRRAPPAACKH